MKSNRWVKWIEMNCDTCGYHYQLKDTQFDFVQPISPFWEMIYGEQPKLTEPIDKEKRRERREEALWRKRKEGKLKPWEEDYVKKYSKERGLD